MARLLLSAAALGLALLASGCLRQNFDLCQGEDPHPDCVLVDASRPDAGPDAEADADADAALDAGP